jgi:hypothetical protein
MISKFQEAHEAFHRQLPSLLAQGQQGRWVLYNGEKQIAVDQDRDKLYAIAAAQGLLEEDIFVDLIASEPDDIERGEFLFR